MVDLDEKAAAGLGGGGEISVEELQRRRRRVRVTQGGARRVGVGLRFRAAKAWELGCRHPCRRIPSASERNRPLSTGQNRTWRAL